MKSKKPFGFLLRDSDLHKPKIFPKNVRMKNFQNKPKRKDITGYGNTLAAPMLKEIRNVRKKSEKKSKVSSSWFGSSSSKKEPEKVEKEKEISVSKKFLLQFTLSDQHTLKGSKTFHDSVLVFNPLYRFIFLGLKNCKNLDRVKTLNDFYDLWLENAMKLKKIISGDSYFCFDMNHFEHPTLFTFDWKMTCHTILEEEFGITKLKTSSIAENLFRLFAMSKQGSFTVFPKTKSIDYNKRILKQGIMVSDKAFQAFSLVYFFWIKWERTRDGPSESSTYRGKSRSARDNYITEYMFKDNWNDLNMLLLEIAKSNDLNFYGLLGYDEKILEGIAESKSQNERVIDIVHALEFLLGIFLSVSLTFFYFHQLKITDKKSREARKGITKRELKFFVRHSIHFVDSTRLRNSLIEEFYEFNEKQEISLRKIIDWFIKIEIIIAKNRMSQSVSFSFNKISKNVDTMIDKAVMSIRISKNRKKSQTEKKQTNQHIRGGLKGETPPNVAIQSEEEKLPIKIFLEKESLIMFVNKSYLLKTKLNVDILEKDFIKFSSKNAVKEKVLPLEEESAEGESVEESPEDQQLASMVSLLGDLSIRSEESGGEEKGSMKDSLNKSLKVKINLLRKQKKIRYSSVFYVFGFSPVSLQSATRTLARKKYSLESVCAFPFEKRDVYLKEVLNSHDESKRRGNKVPCMLFGKIKHIDHPKKKIRAEIISGLVDNFRLEEDEELEEEEEEMREIYDEIDLDEDLEDQQGHKLIKKMKSNTLLGWIIFYFENAVIEVIVYALSKGKNKFKNALVKFPQNFLKTLFYTKDGKIQTKYPFDFEFYLDEDKLRVDLESFSITLHDNYNVSVNGRIKVEQVIDHGEEEEYKFVKVGEEVVKELKFNERVLDLAKIVEEDMLKRASSVK